MTGNTALDRDALYYPYIHITDANWLKSTLLCFPNVRRMVPPGLVPDDSDAIKEFTNVEGPRGPLLTTVDLFSPGATRAEQNLLKKLEANDDYLRSRYSKRATQQEFGLANPFPLHTEKIIPKLFNYLMGSEGDDALAWRAPAPEDRPGRHSGQWLGLHPKLGEAILGVKAMAIAEEFGLDMVTDSLMVHHTVVSQNDEDIFDELIGRQKEKAVPTTDDTVDDLAEIVITTSFDVSKLSARQIADLLANGQDLRRFKDELLPLAASIPAIKNQAERDRRLKAAADDVVEKWKKYKRSLPQFALDALSEAFQLKWPDFLVGGSTYAVYGGAGLGIVLLSYAGIKIFRKYKEGVSSPYAYLSRIAKAQARAQEQQSFLSFPPIV